MSDIEFDCPGCNQHITGPAELLGSSVRCPTCAREFFATSKPKPVCHAPDSTKVKIDNLAHQDVSKVDESFIPAFDRGQIGMALIVLGVLCVGIFLISTVEEAHYGWASAAGALISMGIVLCIWRELIRIRKAVEKLADKPVIK